LLSSNRDLDESSRPLVPLHRFVIQRLHLRRLLRAFQSTAMSAFLELLQRYDIGIAVYE